MSSHEYKPNRLFTIEQANAMLPLVRAITTDLARLGQDVMQRRHRLSMVSTGRNLKSGDPYADELAHMQDELERDQRKLLEYVAELRELGVEPKGAVEGLIDFPCSFDGRVVYLCWKLGESEVLHWHDLEAGFSGRQPLTAGAASHGSESGGFGDEHGESFNE